MNEGLRCPYDRHRYFTGLRSYPRGDADQFGALLYQLNSKYPWVVGRYKYATVRSICGDVPIPCEGRSDSVR